LGFGQCAAPGIADDMMIAVSQWHSYEKLLRLSSRGPKLQVLLVVTVMARSQGGFQSMSVASSGAEVCRSHELKFSQR